MSDGVEKHVFLIADGEDTDVDSVDACLDGFGSSGWYVKLPEVDWRDIVYRALIFDYLQPVLGLQLALRKCEL